MSKARLRRLEQHYGVNERSPCACWSIRMLEPEQTLPACPVCNDTNPPPDDGRVLFIIAPPRRVAR